MAVINLKTLVQRGVAVTGNVVARWTRIAGYQANGRLPVLQPSMRHPSPGCLAAKPERRHDRVDNPDAEHASVRAGRPGSWAGVPVRRSPDLQRLSKPGTDKRLRLPGTGRTERRMQASRTGFRPAGGTPSASTRGRGA